MQQQPAPDLGTLSYRITSLENHVTQLQTELRTYVPASLNEVQLQSIRSTVERIESDVKDAKGQVTTLSTQLSSQTKEQDQLQINVLKWAVGLVVTVLLALLIAYLTHLIN
jgi:DNA repair exonuclease SbcCD ATPase subunit